MGCDHIGGPELIEMAEKDLRARGIAEQSWPGRRFRWAENPAEGMWASLCVEVERRGEQWIVVRLDRNRDPLPDDETGFREVSGA